MCTTVLLIGTLVVMLRRRFFNKVEPYVLSLPRPLGDPLCGDRIAKGGPGVEGPAARPIPGEVWFPSGSSALGGTRQCAPVPGVTGFVVLSSYLASKEEMQDQSCPFVGQRDGAELLRCFYRR